MMFLENIILLFLYFSTSLLYEVAIMRDAIKGIIPLTEKCPPCSKSADQLSVSSVGASNFKGILRRVHRTIY